ncbi:queuosine precursor transporter [Methylophilus luteus]|uniref:Probable queuosine precursor transporter n=1 Tax=Methylophilus luteus TaxID=640108 RepID=A0ABW3F6C2_9PROT
MKKQYRYYNFIMAAFAVVLVCSNIIGPGKITEIQAPLLGSLTFGAGIMFFPISFIFGDILTEVYGYAASRRVIWTGFVCLAFASLMAWVIVALPPAPEWHDQAAYQSVFGSTARIAIASLLSFVAGEFVNSFVLAKMKILTRGRWLWSRTIGSTLFGEAVDTILFFPLAFYGSGEFPDAMMPQILLAQFVAKVLVEIAFTPVTYKAVAFLKRAENEDYYDTHTDFSPFKL